MNVRAIALAVPLALGTAACQHAQKQGSPGTASAGEPAPPREGQQAPGGQTGPLAQDPLIQPGPSILGHAEDQVVEGRIAEVSGEEVSIETDAGDTVTLRLDPATSIELDGSEASSADLEEGQAVRASFDVVEGQEVAVKIRAGDPTGLSGVPQELGVGDDEAAEEGEADAASDQGTGSSVETGSPVLTPPGPGGASGESSGAPR